MPANQVEIELDNRLLSLLRTARIIWATSLRMD